MEEKVYSLCIRFEISSRAKRMRTIPSLDKLRLQALRRLEEEDFLYKRLLSVHEHLQKKER